jgi:predicted ATPase/class 3 adenylate cyclase
MPPERGAEPKGPVTLPTGTVTFLFSDIEGSTQRWEQHREAMDDAVKRHGALLKSAIERQHGYVFKTVGDAVCAAFARVSDAISATANAQRALNAEDFSAVDGLRVRMGVHTGEASERDGDYFGPAVNRVARLMSIGHGGQVLLSTVSRDLAHSDLPVGTLLVDLGSQRLKDLTEPEQVWQLNIAGLPAEFPPLRSLDTLPNNLPIQRTRLVGREHDVAEVRDLLACQRLLTLVGSAGVGKTRLALQVGAELLDHYPDGVWFVDLAPISDQELVSSVIAKALGMSQQEGRRVDESILLWLRHKKLLLILDNCEHVIETVVAITGSILNTAPDICILATSRQALGISGETAHRLPSLSVPSEAGTLQTQQAHRYGAMTLFVDRARAADTQFALTDDNAPIIADICRRLDGIPLAIELAAARVKVISIPNLAKRLNERFKILTGGNRDVLPRQKTLRALIDWSYDLLTPQEQVLFERLGAFAGGFGLDAAACVAGGQGLDEIEILDLVNSLTDKSLVVANTSGDQERYHLLESTRAYAIEKMAASGEREILARRHAEYFRDQAQAADERFGTGSTYAWLAQVEADLDNYRTTLEWALTQSNDVVLGGTMAGALGWMWFQSGLTVEGRYWIVPALEHINESEEPRVAARLLLALSGGSFGKRKYEAAERSTRLYESVGPTRMVARSRFQLAFALNQMGRLEEASEEAAWVLTAARECGDRWGVARCLNMQAAIEGARGNPSAGRELFAQALASFRGLGDEQGVALVQVSLAELEFADGHPERALHLASDALEINLRGKNATNIALNYNNCAVYRVAVGDLTGARESAREGLRWARQAGAGLYIAVALQDLAVLSELGGDQQRSARLLGYVNAEYRALGAERESTEKWGYDKLMAALREKLSEDEITKLAAEGATWSEDQAVEEALKV